MAEQFVVPQFIDAEAKIIGPITARQFVVLLATAAVDAMAYALLSHTLWMIATLPIAGLGLVIAFVKINGQSFHYFLLNIIMTLRRAKLRVWRKNFSDEYLLQFVREEKVPLPEVMVRKEFVGQSRLSELSLMVNTGGAYKSDEDDLN